MGAGWRYDGQLSDVGHRIAHLTRVTQVDRIALQSFDRLGDVHAADRGSDHLLHISNVEPKACSGFAVDIDIDIAASRRALREHRDGAGDRFNHLFDALSNLLNDI